MCEILGYIITFKRLLLVWKGVMWVFSDCKICFFWLFLVWNDYGGVLGMGKNLWGLLVCFLMWL